MKPQSLLFTRRGILWFHLGMEATAGLLILGAVFGIFAFQVPGLLIPYSYFVLYSTFVLPILQLMMVAGVSMVTAAPKESHTAPWAYATLLMGLLATSVTIAIYYFQWPMSWMIAQWQILFIQALLMTRCLLVFSRWIVATERSDVLKLQGESDQLYRRNLMKWTAVTNQLARLFKWGVSFVILSLLYFVATHYFINSITAIFGVWFFVLIPLIAVLLLLFMLMRFSRATYDMNRLLRTDQESASDANLHRQQFATDRIRPWGIAIGLLAFFAVAANQWAQYYMYPEYVQNQLKELAKQFPLPDKDPAIGKLAPEMAMQTLDDASLLMSEQRGHTVLLNFWATWCGPCVKEIPDLDRLSKEFKDDGLVVIGVSDEPAAVLRNFANLKGISYPLVSGKGWGPPFDKITAYPTTYIIDKHGVIRTVFVGSRSYTDFRAAIASAGESDQQNELIANDKNDTDSSSVPTSLAADMQLGGMPTYLPPSAERKQAAISNHSFEQPLSPDWQISTYYQRPESVSITKEYAKHGEQSLKLEAAVDQADDIQCLQAVAVKTLTQYRLSGWIKTRDVVVIQANGETGACISIDDVGISDTVRGTKDWTLVQFNFDSGDRTEIRLGARLGYYGSTCAGTAWFDEIQLDEMVE